MDFIFGKALLSLLFYTNNPYFFTTFSKFLSLLFPYFSVDGHLKALHLNLEIITCDHEPSQEPCVIVNGRPLKGRRQMSLCRSCLLYMTYTKVVVSRSRTAFIKLLSCSTQLSRKFILWTSTKCVQIFPILFNLILYVLSTIFQLNRDGSSWVEPVLN